MFWKMPPVNVYVDAKFNRKVKTQCFFMFIMHLFSLYRIEDIYNLLSLSFVHYET